MDMSNLRNERTHNWTQAGTTMVHWTLMRWAASCMIKGWTNPTSPNFPMNEEHLKAFYADCMPTILSMTKIDSYKVKRC